MRETSNELTTMVFSKEDHLIRKLQRRGFNSIINQPFFLHMVHDQEDLSEPNLRGNLMVRVTSKQQS